MSTSVKIPEDVLDDLREHGDGTHSETLRDLLPNPSTGAKMEFGERKQIDVDGDLAFRLSALSGNGVPNWMVIRHYLNQTDE